MKTSLKTLLTTLTLAGATLLTGCATPNLQATFTRGDEVMYGMVTSVLKGEKIVEYGTLCQGKWPKLKTFAYSNEVDDWVKATNYCEPGARDGLQHIVAQIGVVNVNGDMWGMGGYAPIDVKIEKGDIVAVKVYPSSDGRFRRPGEILRVAAKAKDATKENGCYWDAGTGTFRGFNQGGVICEGWHWKNHPYSNPSLLKN